MEAMLMIVPLTVQWLLCLMMVEILTAGILDLLHLDGASILKRKIGMLIAVALGYILDEALAPAIGIAELVGTFYLVVQTLAILENLARLGVPLPEELLRRLRRMAGV